MGGAVSAGQDNNELIDNLCNENYIQTPEVEAVSVCYVASVVRVYGSERVGPVRGPCLFNQLCVLYLARAICV